MKGRDGRIENLLQSCQTSTLVLFKINGECFTRWLSCEVLLSCISLRLENENINRGKKKECCLCNLTIPVPEVIARLLEVASTKSWSFIGSGRG